MKVACLFSGGKDSTFSLYLAKRMGLSIECLLTLIPYSPESYLFHYPNIWITSIQSQALEIPIITKKIQSSSIDEEDGYLYNLIKIAIKDYQIEGIVHGGISSNFQRNKFYDICSILCACHYHNIHFMYLSASQSLTRIRQATAAITIQSIIDNAVVLKTP